MDWLILILGIIVGLILLIPSFQEVGDETRVDTTIEVVSRVGDDFVDDLLEEWDTEDHIEEISEEEEEEWSRG